MKTEKWKSNGNLMFDIKANTDELQGQFRVELQKHLFIAIVSVKCGKMVKFIVS